MNKKSIQFFNDRKQLLVLLVTDVVRAPHDESDYNKAGNYWC